MKQLPDSNEFAQMMTEIHREIEDRVHGAGVTDRLHVMISMITDFNGKFRLSISFTDGYAAAANVEGKELWVLVEEYLRRKKFSKQQELVQIGPVEIEGKVGE